MWKPGKANPLRLNVGGKRKKKNKRGSKAAKKKRQRLEVLSNTKSETEKNEDLQKVPSLYSPDPARAAEPGKKQKVSDALSRLRFMSRKTEKEKLRKQEAERHNKEQQERWVAPDLDKVTDKTDQLICTQLSMNPARVVYRQSRSIGSSSTRRSFGNFNTNIDSLNESMKLTEKQQKEAEYVDANAISKEEMADFFAKK